MCVLTPVSVSDPQAHDLGRVTWVHGFLCSFFLFFMFPQFSKKPQMTFRKEEIEGSSCLLFCLVVLSQNSSMWFFRLNMGLSRPSNLEGLSIFTHSRSDAGKKAVAPKLSHYTNCLNFPQLCGEI